MSATEDQTATLQSGGASSEAWIRVYMIAPVDRAEKRLRMCGLSWRAQPGNNNKPYKNGGVFKILRVASSFSRKSRVCLKTVD